MSGAAHKPPAGASAAGRRPAPARIAYTGRTIQVFVTSPAKQAWRVVAVLVAGVAGASAQGGEWNGPAGTQRAPQLESSVAGGGDFRPAAPYRPPSGEERLRLYVRRAFWSPGVPFRAAVPALASHLADRPPEWGQGSAGFGRRLADRYARVVVKESYEAAGAAALGHDVRYLASGRTGAWRRAGHALAATVVTRDRQGRRVPHVARVGAAFAAEFTGNTWMPAGYHSRAGSVRSVALGLSFTGMANLAREFAPEIRRLLPGR